MVHPHEEAVLDGSAHVPQAVDVLEIEELVADGSAHELQTVLLELELDAVEVGSAHEPHAVLLVPSAPTALLVAVVLPVWFLLALHDS